MKFTLRLDGGGCNREREFEGSLEEAKAWLEDRGDHLGNVDWVQQDNQHIAQVVIADYVFGPYDEKWIIQEVKS